MICLTVAFLDLLFYFYVELLIILIFFKQPLKYTK